ncbi:peptide ABC transporter permease [Curtobacterium sp. MMLR14_014]|jgi:peptide/nickel transport system permease protein|uniref:ABC transporter permease n=1 Tax=unclassified Curtobacterium TaxID=257496 RepID=UPI0008F92C22|nr:MULTISPECIES: ABC transporter permease [unclassified Curtobacterium]OII35913.1 peptide ABC transporter permease [Curtobacterium sp. MMLR14_002]OII45662.1 peptide ABC transporter permease [Curtobacterium sp. MMLR14_014]WIE69983.1 ABC transporter permease [Curtobacterium sp. MCLR17_054]
MTRYVLSRIGQALLVLWAAWTISFFVLYVLPSDPARIMVGPDATDVTAAQLDALRHQYGLDQPVLVQYFQHLGSLFTGDLGRSIGVGRPVADVIGEAIAPTAQIALAGLVLAIVFGGGIAVLATWTRNRALGQFLLQLPPIGVAVPGFWFALLLVQWFSFGLHLFPAFGGEGPASVVLPAITLALPTGATIAQLLSKSLVQTLREPYVDTAYAKGAGRWRVQLRHALRNAALPALTVTGLIVGQLFSGTVVTETVFSRPGLGRVTATAVQQQDIPVVQGIVLLAAAIFVVVNLVVDLVYPLLDPRVVIADSRRKLRDRDGATPGATPGAPGTTPSSTPEPKAVHA